MVCALAVGLTASLGTVASARGIDLTPLINATRRSQLTYEASMVSADRELKSLKREQRRAARFITKVSARLTRLMSRRHEMREQRDAAGERYHLARASVEASGEPGSPYLRGPASTLRLPAIPALTPRLPLVIERHDEAASGNPIGEVVEPGRPATLEEVDGLHLTFKSQKRQTRKMERKTRHVQKVLHTKKRKVSSMRQRRRAALAQRAHSEAALKAQIQSMARLALQRAARKTRVRPGYTTPFVWPTMGRISQHYGCTGSSFSPPRGSCAHFHDGIDIVAGHAAAIRAAGVGVISYVGRNPWDRGKRAFMVVISHPGGYESLYAHVLPIRRVDVGQVVRKGQLIAFMGSTGHSTGTHLHFELRRGRTTINPLSKL